MKIYFEGLKRDKYFWLTVLALALFSYCLIEIAIRSESDFENRRNYCGTLIDFKETTSGAGLRKSVRQKVHVLFNDEQLVEVFSISFWKNTHNELRANIGSPICISALPSNAFLLEHHIFQITLNDKNLISLLKSRKRYFSPNVKYFYNLLWWCAFFTLLWRSIKINRKKQ